MTRLPLLPLLALSLLILDSEPVAAQVREPRTVDTGGSRALSLWGSAGVSLMAQPMFGGTSLSLGAVRGNAALRVGYDAASSFKGTETLRAAGVSLGFRTRVGPLHLGAFAGPALVWVEFSAVAGRPVGARHVTAGAAIDASALFGFGSRVALGVGAWTNVNPRLSTVGAGPALRIRLHGKP